MHFCHLIIISINLLIFQIILKNFKNCKKLQKIAKIAKNCKKLQLLKKIANNCRNCMIA